MDILDFSKHPKQLANTKKKCAAALCYSDIKNIQINQQGALLQYSESSKDF